MPTSSNTVLNVTGLSFDQIRSDLRNFLAAKPVFRDVDFTDSAVGTLLDLLAYNSYRLAFYVNMASNEAFLDTAQLYDSVVSRAKAIGYTPISAKGASANVKITFGLTANATVRSLTIAKDTRFTATVNGTSYPFVTPQAYTVPANSTNGFVTYITLTEGQPLTHVFTTSVSNTAFTLPNANTDVSSIFVAVTEGSNTTNYALASDIFVVGGNTKVFFVEADTNSRYKILFGDGVIGYKPPVGATVAVSYRVCSASKPNGANTFTAVSTVAGLSNFTLRTIERAVGGSEQEPIASIKYNAPRMYETQGRAVTAEDYKRIILRDNPDLSGVNVWGGEDNVPPVYGKVYVAVKPIDGSTIGTNRKEQIKTSLKRYNVQSIEPEMVDATFLYLVPAVSVQYDPNLSTDTPSDIAAAAATAMASYESTTLNRFDGKFRASKFLEAVDQSHAGIVGSSISLHLSKRFVPDLTRASSYTFMFNHTLNLPNIGHLYALASTAFTYKSQRSFLDDDGMGNVRIYYANVDGSRTYTNSLAGTIDYVHGTVVLSNFLPVAFEGEEIALTVEPPTSDYNVVPVRNQILLLRSATVSVVNDRTGLREINNWTVSTLGSSLTLLSPSYSGAVNF